ncbi:CCR4-NOT transcription complex subunit 1 [Camellia lanceoleosa]|uniref:CCR4-NOT transcription complex subunit 1 n=1 Tax=Camellia lanceoleosa TaxID=1840588 RepID=A0ACC0G040_9ERIC|nr:CCR4-NOT transcription complex subunit 1 [Camellia lanceoleosa]
MVLISILNDLQEEIEPGLSNVIYSDKDRKFNTDITVGLICSGLLNLAEYNVHMAKLLDRGMNKAATEFAISLIQTLLINDSKVISKLHDFVDALAKLAVRLGFPESLQQLVEVARNPTANPATLSTIFVGEDNTRQATEQKLVRRLEEQLWTDVHKIMSASSLLIWGMHLYTLS